MSGVVEPDPAEVVDAGAGVDPSGEPVDPEPTDADAEVTERVEVEEAGSRDFATVRGRCVDRFGEGIEGVQVDGTVRMFPIRRRTARVETDADGHFVVRGVSPGRARFTFKHPDYCELTSETRKVAVGERVELGELPMFRGTEVTGHVHVDGQPARGIQLWLLPEKGQPAARGRGDAVFSGRDGHFKARRRLPPGRYRVLAMPALQFGTIASRGAFIVSEFDVVAGENERKIHVDIRTDR